MLGHFKSLRKLARNMFDNESEILHLSELGLTSAAIAQHLQVPRSYVRRILASELVPMQPAPAKRRWECLEAKASNDGPDLGECAEFEAKASKFHPSASAPGT